MCTQHDQGFTSQNLMSNLAKFPVVFPVSREFASESGSHLTPPTANKSIESIIWEKDPVFFLTYGRICEVRSPKGTRENSLRLQI
jgi:hypothetical protein